ncbi:MAG TPA: glycosyltransferase family 1 protein, partial [Candidatus Binatia bacterium]|nr:glycosyltransferase family 1 protein [Candidatus Binatia bacterium]
MRILVSGLIGQYAFGGVTWDYVQYVLGFRALGHDVWYLEDSANWAYDPVKQEPSADCSHNVSYLDRIMREFDMGDRWIYRNEPDGKYHGISDERLAEKTIAEADVLANVSGA